MAAKPPGDFTPIDTSASVRDALKGPILTPLPYQPPSYTTNGTYGRMCTLQHPYGEPNPNQTYLSQGLSPAEERRQREERRKQMNTIGLWIGGITTAPGALVRLLGGSEDSVEKAAEMGFNYFSPTPGAPGTPLATRYW
ncbi:hypothetical protein [Chondromyces apiculatus]|uniref:Uncharacterized protein n=1 Tax=Chondromyces apiculatus DSM 436 TaxID=1192034 RepID=A0A017T8U6_9BACT|nr:hypothetical protein [Chondromyces apiculatus]EYF05387.1 Hypothetical protein CAP_3304 [Chondromyces apiculatus DSM 436]